MIGIPKTVNTGWDAHCALFVPTRPVLALSVIYRPVGLLLSAISCPYFRSVFLRLFYVLEVNFGLGQPNLLGGARSWRVKAPS